MREQLDTLFCSLNTCCVVIKEKNDLVKREQVFGLSSECLAGSFGTIGDANYRPIFSGRPDREGINFPLCNNN